MGSANITNGFDKKLTSQFVADIERLEQEQESKKGEYMAWCQRQRELINGHLDRAKESGIPKRSLKDVLKVRKIERKLADIRDDMEPEDAETFDMIRHALGDLADLPLGQSSLAKSKAVDSILDDDIDPGAIIAAENEKTLKGGLRAVK